MSGVFVTGTDTGCGKTRISLGLMAAWQAQDQRVLGMKPVASGCDLTADGPRNADALSLLHQGSTRVAYEMVNPYAFTPAIAPHVAAERAGITISLDRIMAGYGALAARCDRLVVEGVGGWRVPLSRDLEVADIPLALGLPVILVVGLRLGCLNHALLTTESILARGADLAGWIGNQIDPGMTAIEENLGALETRIPAPCLGLVPWLSGPGPARLALLLHPERIQPKCPTSPAAEERTQRIA